MTKDEVIQQRKNEALNSITKIYNPLYKFHYDQYDECSASEQRESKIKIIIDNLNEDLKVIKENFKTKIK